MESFTLYHNITNDDDLLLYSYKLVTPYTVKLLQSEGKTMNVEIKMFSRNVYDFTIYAQNGSYFGSVTPDSVFQAPNLLSVLHNAFTKTHGGNTTICIFSFFFSFIVVSTLSGTDRMYSIPLAETTVSFITPCLTLFMLLFSAITIYRFVSDDESGRRSILYLNNVTTGSYYLSLLIFYSCMMVIAGLICGTAVYFCNIISNTLLLYMFGYFVLAGLLTASFSLFIGILVNQK